MRRLNRLHRGVDRPTDVLSFPQAGPWAGGGRRRAGGPAAAPRAVRALLGDVVVSLDTAERVAREEGRALPAELDRYLAHGLLHLLGHDHHRPAQARRMAAAEDALVGAGMVRAGMAGAAARRRRPAGEGEVKRAALLSVASGLALALALPLAIPWLSLRELDPAGHLEALAWVGLVPALLALDRARTARAAFGLGLLAGLAYVYAAIWWVNHAMTSFGGVAVPRGAAGPHGAGPLHGRALGGSPSCASHVIRGPPRLAAVDAPARRLDGHRAVPELPLHRLPLGQPGLHSRRGTPPWRSSPR